MRRQLTRVPLLAAAILLWSGVGGPSVQAAAYDRFYANFAGEELMRAVNADRASLGLAVLATDSTLASIARDRSVACPSNGKLILRGRARDMADRNYLSHVVPGCADSAGGTFDTFDLLKAFGYSYAGAGENISSNNFPTSATTYAVGCSLSGSGCHGSTTLPWTVAVAERSFMSSGEHRALLLSAGYNRFGCGAWTSSSGNRYFACYFVSSGNGALDGTGPTISHKTGVGATFAAGSKPTFTASASDGRSVLSDGWAAIDGVHIRNWAWDHAGSSSSFSATAPALKVGTHTFTWWVRDASTHATTASFHFTVTESGGPVPTRTARPTARPTSAPTTRSSPGPTPGASSPPGPSGALPSTGPATSAPSRSADAVGAGSVGSSPDGTPGSSPGGPRSAGSGAASADPGTFVLLTAILIGWTALVIGLRSDRVRRVLGGAAPGSSAGGDPTPP